MEDIFPNISNNTECKLMKCGTNIAYSMIIKYAKQKWKCHSLVKPIANKSNVVWT